MYQLSKITEMKWHTGLQSKICKHFPFQEMTFRMLSPRLVFTCPKDTCTPVLNHTSVNTVREGNYVKLKFVFRESLGKKVESKKECNLNDCLDMKIILIKWVSD